MEKSGDLRNVVQDRRAVLQTPITYAQPPQVERENSKYEGEIVGNDFRLVLAADQFIILPAGRVEEVVAVRAAGDEVRTVIAEYHWFTDWGRDTMISLEGSLAKHPRQEKANQDEGRSKADPGQRPGSR